MNAEKRGPLRQLAQRLGVVGSEFERRGRHLRAPRARLGPMPLVSVVMTMHDSARWLQPAMESILGQTWKNLQLIVVDDASRDHSIAIAEAARLRDPRIEVVGLEHNVGTYRAKNAGLCRARGEAITFMDSDDTCAPDRIERQLAALREPGIVATTCNYVRQTADGTVVLNQGLRERLALISLMVKRQVIDEIGWFDGVRTSADYEYFQRLRAVYGRAAHTNVDAPLYLALLREKSLTTQPGIGTRVDGGEGDLLSAPRRQYVEAFTAWHDDVRARGRRPYMPRMTERRPFDAPKELLERIDAH